MKKYLAKFSDEAAYNDHFWNGESVTPNVTLIADTGKVKHNYLKHPKVNLFDILYSDASSNLSTSAEVLDPAVGKTPIGLCIAPSGFFFPNEPARFMALKYASIDTPDTGSIASSGICWGQNGNTIIGTLLYINGYESDSVFNTTDIMCYDSETHTFDWSNLSFRNPMYGDNPLYVYPWDVNGPSYPYVSLYDANNNWNINPNIYFRTQNEPFIDAGPLSLKGGAFGDINGKANTAALLAAYTAEDYRTTITNLPDGGYSPAAACCWRYHTLGTNQGDWYLGAAGEMAMIVTNFGQIQAKLWKIAEKYPDNCFSQLSQSGYWSSSEYGSDRAWTTVLTFYVSHIGNSPKSGTNGIPVFPLLMW